MAARLALARDLQSWLAQLQPSVVQPLLPSFQARAIWCVRGAIAMAAAAAFFLDPAAASIVAGNALVAVAAVTSTTTTLGASVSASFRCIAGGGWATAYALAVISAFRGMATTADGGFPATGVISLDPLGSQGVLAVALVFAAIFVWIVSYSSASVAAKRLAMSTCVLELLLWYQNPAITTATYVSMHRGWFVLDRDETTSVPGLC